uniref:Uncharacterized protein n=1 Tax=Rhodochaete parvula TaxID=110510 RepID=A0A1X9PUV8_9RHOD|nr:hypothetical protein [Rhodochaete parvula]
MIILIIPYIFLYNILKNIFNIIKVYTLVSKQQIDVFITYTVYNIAKQSTNYYIIAFLQINYSFYSYKVNYLYNFSIINNHLQKVGIILVYYVIKKRLPKIIYYTFLEVSFSNLQALSLYLYSNFQINLKRTKYDLSRSQPSFVLVQTKISCRNNSRIGMLIKNQYKK